MEKDIIENKEAIYEYINDILIPWNIWEFNLNSDDIFNNKIRKYESKYY